MSVDPRRLADSYQPTRDTFGLDWVPPKTRAELEQLSDKELFDYMLARQQVEKWAVENPVGSGWVPPAWRKVLEHWQSHRIHVILGGNRSGKSVFASRLCVWAMANIPEAEVRGWHVNKMRSNQDMQRLIYEALPASLKSFPTSRGKYHAMSWSQANGFTNDVLIIPAMKGWTKGGRMDFNNYASYQDDPQVAEGFKIHLGWLDEESPQTLFKTLLQRTTDYHGRLVLTFTTLNGWTPLVEDILGKVRVIESRYAPLVKRKLPVLQESLRYDGMMIYNFWTEDNPFIDTEEFRQKMKGLHEDEVLARAYGVPTKAAKAAFPMFSRDVHVLKSHDDLPWIKNPNYEVTRYHICDPGGSKNDFMGWVAIDQAGTWWVYREWPDHETYGEWALPGSTVEGKAGPAQTSLGWGFDRETEEIEKLEAGEEIFERLVDPRMGAQEKKADEGATNFITDFEKHGIVLVPAPGVDIKSGLKKINELLHYNPDKPRDSRNSPRIFFSPKCENWIHMMSEYTATSGTEHTKEGPDLLRYLAMSNPIFVRKQDMGGTNTTGSYGGSG